MIWDVHCHFPRNFMQEGDDDPAKDIDGNHPMNAGLLRLGYDGFLPATAHAAVEILRRSGIEIEGKRAVVVGRSAVVGMPAAFLLVRDNATVTV